MSSKPPQSLCLYGYDPLDRLINHAQREIMDADSAVGFNRDKLYDMQIDGVSSSEVTKLTNAFKRGLELNASTPEMNKFRQQAHRIRSDYFSPHPPK